MLERVWRKGNPLTLLVGMQTSTATMENSVEIPLKTGYRTAIWPSNPTSGHTHWGNQNWKRHMYPILNPPPSPYHPSGSSQCTSPKHPVLCIEPGLVTHFIHYILRVSMPVSQIFPPSPSPIESKRLFYTSVSLLLSRIQGYCYHLSKFHIYALVYCIGVFLSGLLHSV